MSYKFKEFFTLEEARTYISITTESPIPITDLYRYAIDKNLIISVRLIDQVNAIVGQVINGAEVNFNQFYLNLVNNKKIEEPFSICLDNGLCIEKNRWAFFDEEVYLIDGVWDLAMLGMETLEIEKLYHEELGGRSPKKSAHKGIFLQRDDDICKLQTKLSLDLIKENNLDLYKEAEDILSPKNITIDNYFDDKGIHHLFTLSENDKLARFFEKMREQSNSMECFEDTLTLEGYQFVIKTKELIRFVQSLQEEEFNLQQEEKPLLHSERNSLLVIIAALLKEQNITPPYKAIAPVIDLMIQKSGNSCALNTISKHLSKAAELIS
jgi:hypothetical protein